LRVFHPPPYYEEVIPYPQSPGRPPVVAMIDEESVEYVQLVDGVP
jgi:hypothetical protein